ncbi:hypothetical protein EJ02DRAFT_50948 [Clathrospora elynae]|uniref:Uncharacterized protein n=1 Tax=Clathrospora elynae TaxID=706981 RepID=A0A6A5SC23_9PLEO|nr:hypothetical protein EJ02DRAFT_50948 [Clathrospora elynae]
MSSNSSTSTADPMQEMRIWHDSFWVEAKWPAARNDHYCSHAVCRHAVIDLAIPDESSDSEEGKQWPPSPTDYDCRQTRCLPVIDSRATHSEDDAYLLEDGCIAFTRVDQSGSPTCSFLSGVQGSYCEKHPSPRPTTSAGKLTATVDENEDAQEFIKLVFRENMNTRAQLDKVQESLKTTTTQLEEKYASLTDTYRELDWKHENLALKHDALVDVTHVLCEELRLHAECFEKLNARKHLSQNAYAKAHLRDQSPEFIYYETPSSPPTVNITLDDEKPTSTFQKPGDASFEHSSIFSPSQKRYSISAASLRSTHPMSPDTVQGTAKKSYLKLRLSPRSRVNKVAADAMHDASPPMKSPTNAAPLPQTRASPRKSRPSKKREVMLSDEGPAKRAKQGRV